MINCCSPRRVRLLFFEPFTSAYFKKQLGKSLSRKISPRESFDNKRSVSEVFVGFSGASIDETLWVLSWVNVPLFVASERPRALIMTSEIQLIIGRRENLPTQRTRKEFQNILSRGVNERTTTDFESLIEY